MSKGFASNYRIVLLGVGVVACFGCIAVRLLDLHVFERERLMGYVDRARRQITVEPAKRGDILDDKGDRLATSRSLIVLGVDPQALLKADESKWPELAKLLNLPQSEVRRILTTKSRTAPLAKPVAVQMSVAAASATPEDSTADETLPSGEKLIRWAKLSDTVEESTYDQIRRLNIKGVYGNRTYTRAYPHNQLAAHLIGFVNKAGEPAAGLEAFADFYLRGQDGWRESEKDGLRRELAQFRNREVSPTAGYTVRLSIDAAIQHIVEQEIDEIVKKFNPAKVTVIVSEPHSGFVLALGNYPTFNLNEYNELSKEAMGTMRNLAITDVLDPGSTFKIVAASGAINDKLVTPASRFDCSIDSIEYKGKPRRFMKDDHRFDHPLTVAEIISHSSNVGAAQLGMKLGEETLYRYARAFGFGEKSGFPFGGEVSGFLNPAAKWSGVDITRISAGYSISATPMQIHYAMATIASGGALMRPQVIRQVADNNGEAVYNFTGSVRRQVLSTKTAEQMARMLEGVASKEGTAPMAAIPSFEVAGKTGTAQKLINGHYSDRNHVGSFVGFFPASRPRVVISVIVDDARVPSGRIAYGSTVAAPSFKHIAEQLIQYLDIKPVIVPGRNLLVMEGGHR
ncbi:MAG: penicillin-binding protein 2 [Opitutus sp.]|nr:penicillin-binding protein 2 [Opitutus sp.]MCS6247794.1 penicillin-binding protein 2 [Opitutus sp.]MCS6274277.1 penicillin-binding protein 2 [Opitutus sp.]MCS6277616.1 penicillin-binding protein 2 [Opitutus sp.]MCS6300734.1 penicillin-binding protein 2 [Opitutus sp.]